ncbi:MAG: alpha-ketoacid dehydrogenase subunit beta [Bacillota bacterium]|uniref:Alpha-ketoacid dehydrogenase subunit beta n=1 Tax=Thermanaerosceptrum fracticalcis TaxID=1712410 RepID=A0A7G6E4E6_THEFR|nr:alpha-ketoacid dehydrogenase subunit beta [Thermanaerosceptrum fracticalcis]QNB46950.1 alpha-ketoacid dehydrogenase subunit beta [Thermanaerosceptrum fracticalcis]
MRSILYVEAVREAIREEMLRDEKVFVMGEDVALHGGIFGATKGLFQEFGGERVRNTPISESAIIGSAIGAAVTGMRPIAELMYVDFVCVAMDQIVNQAAKLRYMFGGKAKLPMVIRTQQGGGRGNAAQHSQSLEAWFMHTPGLKVVMPSTPYDAKGLLKTAIRDDNPVLFLEHKLLYWMKGEVPEEEYTIPFGKADIKRQGTDVTIVALAMMVPKALEAAEILAKKGISVEIVDPRTLVPLDKETILESVKKTGRVVVAHEANKVCGVGAEISAMIMEEAFDYLDAPVMRVAGMNVPVPYNKKLEDICLPQVQDIVTCVEKLLG